MALDIPNRLYFTYSFPCQYLRKTPNIDGDLGDLEPEFLVPDLGFLEDIPKVSDVYMAWNEQGLYFGVEVKKKRQVRSSFARHWTGDSFQIWLDTRDVKTARRAGRHCHQFNCLPTGGGPNGDLPIVKPTQIDRSKEKWNVPLPEDIPVASRITSSGYTLEVALPADILSGYDPEEFPRLGFTYYLNNSEWPSQWWSADRDLRVYIDPSTWGTAVLRK